jgi:hypothetical protein
MDCYGSWLVRAVGMYESGLNFRPTSGRYISCAPHAHPDSQLVGRGGGVNSCERVEMIDTSTETNGQMNG